MNSIQLRTKGKVKFTNWNIMDTPPIPTEFTDRDEYMVMVTHGLDAEPMHITLDFEVCIVDKKLVVD